MFLWKIPSKTAVNDVKWCSGFFFFGFFLKVAVDLSYCRKTDVVLFNANVLHVREKTTGAQGQVSYTTTYADILIHMQPRR